MLLTGSISLHSRAIGAYLGLAVGDALGATVEFMTPREIRAQFGVHDRIRGGGWLNLKRGSVTDDTTMTLALGRAIIEAGGIDALACARAFDQWMRARPVDIGNTVRRGLVHFRATGDTSVPPREEDAGNGACMRCLPVALATFGRSDEEVRAAARVQAHVTHNNPLSDAATELVVLMVQQALSGRRMVELLGECVGPALAARPEFRFRTRRMENPSGYVVETMRAILQALFDTDTFECCLIDVVNRGGDADTTGAIAGMVAGAVYGRAAIPSHWVDAVDPAVTQACEQQALALIALSRSGLRAPHRARVTPVSSA